MSPSPTGWRAPLDLNRREGPIQLTTSAHDTRIGLIAAILWYFTGDAQLSIAICPESALRLRGCQLLAYLLRLTRGGRP